jgi:hypothetical protein
VSVTGPTELPAASQGSFTITVSNTSATTAHGVQLSVSFPNVPSQEANNGDTCPLPCPGNGHGSLVSSIGDMAPGASLAFVFGFTTHVQAVLRHPWTVTSTDVAGTLGTYSVIVQAPKVSPPKTTTAFTLAMSKVTRISGLKASETATLKNVGTHAALAASLAIELDNGVDVLSYHSTSGACTHANPIVVSCDLGTVAPGAVVKLELSVHLPVDADNLSDFLAEEKASNAAVEWAHVRPYFLGRYWSFIGAKATYPNGWTVPGMSAGYTIGPDDTVHLAGGYFIAPNGVLHFPDGRTIVVDSLGKQHFVPAPKRK